MPQNAHLVITSGWTLITDANVTGLTFQNLNPNDIFVQGTNGTSPPAVGGGIKYPPETGERAVAVADLFPGVSGVNRVWARVSGVASGMVFVSHA